MVQLTDRKGEETAFEPGRLTLVVTGNECRYQSHDRDDLEKFVIEIDPASSPKRITFRYSLDLFDDPTVAAAVIEATTARCIYRLQGDSLTIRSGDTLRKDYPADFAISAKADSSDSALMVFRRKKGPR